MVTIMDKDKKLNYRSAIHVLQMLEGIPEDLKSLFVPKTMNELAQFELNIIMWLVRSKEREKVIMFQKHYGLPLKPNQSIREVQIRLKILELKKKK